MTTNYAVEFLPIAVRELQNLPAKVRVQVAKRIDSLAGNPRPEGCQKLRDRDGVYRIRSGNYRVLYRIEDKRLVVLVVRIAHRRDVYR